MIKNLKLEKENLNKVIQDENESNANYFICEKIQNEIKHFKNITDSCLKSCSQLTTEIVGLKKDLEKFNYNNSTVSSNVNNNFYLNKSNGASNKTNKNSKKNSQVNLIRNKK